MRVLKSLMRLALDYYHWTVASGFDLLTNGENKP